MTKENLESIINNYQNYTRQITLLDDNFGIDLWQSDNGFIVKIEQVIYDLTIELFQDNVNHFWNYIFHETDMSFDELCEVLNIHDK